MSEAEKAPEPETGSTNSPEVSQPAEASSDPAKASTPTEDSNPVSESGGDGPVTKETAKSSEDKDAGEETSNEQAWAVVLTDLRMSLTISGSSRHRSARAGRRSSRKA